MITVIVVGLAVGIFFHLALQDWEVTIMCSLMGLIVGFILAVIIGACFPSITMKESTRQLEILNVGPGESKYYLQAIDAYKTTDYYIFQSGGKIFTVSDGGRKVEYRDIAKPYVEYSRTEVDFSRVPKWVMLFGFGNFFHKYNSAIFYIPNNTLYEVP